MLKGGVIEKDQEPLFREWLKTNWLLSLFLVIFF